LTGLEIRLAVTVAFVRFVSFVNSMIVTFVRFSSVEFVRLSFSTGGTRRPGVVLLSSSSGAAVTFDAFVSLRSSANDCLVWSDWNSDAFVPFVTLSRLSVTVRVVISPRDAFAPPNP
jgi:hypothetical protein